MTTTATIESVGWPLSAGDSLPTELLVERSDAALKAAACPLRAGYESVGAARGFVRRMARSWGIEGITDDLELVATELVANALRHGVRLPMGHGTPAAPSADRRHPPVLRPVRDWSTAGEWPVELSLLLSPSRVMCVVNDPSDEVPVRRVPDLVTGSGRGLQLIDSLSIYWGWTALQRDGHAAGKAVWTVMAVDGVPGGRRR